MSIASADLVHAVDIELNDAVSCFGCGLMKDNHVKRRRSVHSLVDIEHEDPVLRAFVLFLQAAREVERYQDAYMLRKMGLSEIKLIVLMAFYRDPTATLTPSMIAGWTQTKPHNVTTLIDRMKRDGLVITERDSKNKRYVNIRLTDKGREVFDQAMPVAQEIVNDMMSSISRDDAVLFEKHMKIVRDNAHRGLENIARGSQSGHQSTE